MFYQNNGERLVAGVDEDLLGLLEVGDPAVCDEEDNRVLGTSLMLQNCTEKHIFPNFTKLYRKAYLKKREHLFNNLFPLFLWHCY